MAKFKVGDIIKANEDSNKEYLVTNQKNDWTGIVRAVESDGIIRVATLTPERYKGEVYTVEEAYFYIAENRPNITHIVNKNAVIVKLDGGRKGVAKCSPDDKFNLAFGTALAVARAYGDKETEAKLLAEPAAPVKEEPKFKGGELVRIRQWDDMEKEIGVDADGDINSFVQFVTSMKPLCGKYAEIIGLAENGVEVKLKFFNCGGLETSWGYSTDMIEKV